MWEETFHLGDLFPALTVMKDGQGILLARAACQVTLIQSNQIKYAIVGYVGQPALVADTFSRVCSHDKR